MATPTPRYSNCSCAACRRGADSCSPPGWQQALDFLEHLRFSSADIDWLKSTGRFNKNLLDYLGDFRFSGEVHAIAEGTAFFAKRTDSSRHRAAAAGAAG